MHRYRLGPAAVADAHEDLCMPGQLITADHAKWLQHLQLRLLQRFQGPEGINVDLTRTIALKAGSWC